MKSCILQRKQAHLLVRSSCVVIMFWASQEHWKAFPMSSLQQKMRIVENFQEITSINQSAVLDLRM